MKWIAACIKNKLIIYILAFLLCVIGIFCITLMNISPLPETPASGMSITINYPGANAQTVQRQVATKIVTGLQAINNVQSIVANSKAGSARIELALRKESPYDVLQTQMQITQAIASSDLPPVVHQPKIKLDTGYAFLMWMALTSNQTPLFNLETIAQSTLLPTFNSLPNVNVNTNDFNPVVKVMLSPEAIAAYHLNPTTIAQTLNAVYQSNPLGKLNIENQTYVLNMSDNFQTLNELRNIMVGYQHTGAGINATSLFGTPIYLKDIATIKFEPRDIVPEDVFKVDGKTAVRIGLDTASSANPFDVSKKVNAYLKTFQKELPSDVKILKVYDVSTLMHASINEVISTIAISSILVILIAFIFLGSLRATLIPIITIPVCLLSAITFLFLLGFSINLFTLLALVIAVGLVVDDAVVVVENITRYLEQGMKKHQAIVQGTSDIALTIVGITLTLVVVYVPIMFLSNRVADLFKPFAITLASAIFVSGIIALTLTPVMAITLLSDKPHSNYQIQFDQFLKNIIAKYHRILAFIIRNKNIALTIIVVLVIAGGYFAMQLPKKVYPNEPIRVVKINIIGSYQDTVSSLEKRLDDFSSFYKDKKMSAYLIWIYKNQSSGQLDGGLVTILKPQYIKSTYALVDKISQFIKTKHLENTYAKAANFFDNGNTYDVSFYIYGGSDIGVINQAAANITTSMKKSDHFSFVTNEINEPQRQLMFQVNKSKAASLGIFSQSITQLLSTYYSGYTLNNYFNIAGLSVPIVVQANNDDLTNPASLQKLTIQSPLTQKYYPLTDFVSLGFEAQPLVLTTFNGKPAVEIRSNLNHDYSMGQAISYVDHFMQHNYSSLQYQYVDNARDYLRGNNETLMIALMGIMSVYFLLAILFKNLIDPLIIMLTVPFTIVGGALSLYLIGGSINLFSALGLITLVGLITKHGILIVQFANNELKKGKSVVDAILTSTALRFRPIIMTTLVMIFGALPLVFSGNTLYVSRENLGITIVGGLAIGTLFSLFIIPLIYVLIKKMEGNGSVVDNENF